MKRAYVCSSFVFVALVIPAISLSKAETPDSIEEQARKVHFSSILLEHHIDGTPNLQTSWKFTDEHKEGHIDLPRMKKGGLNALFFSIYMSGTVTGPKAVNDSLERIAAVHRLAEEKPDKGGLGLTPDDVRKGHKQGKISALMGMGGGHMIKKNLPVFAI